MNALKKFLGIIWILLGPVSLYYLITTAAGEIAKKPTVNTKMQWIVFIGVFVPIAIGLMIFGYYALKGEYEHLPESSGDLERGDH